MTSVGKVKKYFCAVSSFCVRLVAWSHHRAYHALGVCVHFTRDKLEWDEKHRGISCDECCNCEVTCCWAEPQEVMVCIWEILRILTQQLPINLTFSAVSWPILLDIFKIGHCCYYMPRVLSFLVHCHLPLFVVRQLKKGHKIVCVIDFHDLSRFLQEIRRTLFSNRLQ
jgi:hypothetical protein